MKFVIKREVLGIRSDLLYDSGTFRWVSDFPEDAWVFGEGESHIKDVKIIMRSLGQEIPVFPSLPIRRAWSTLFGSNELNIPWREILGSNMFLEHTRSLVDQLRLFLSNNYDGYHMNQFVNNRGLILSLKRPKINLKKYESAKRDLKAYAGNYILTQFRPDSNGFCDKIVYNQTGSLTGRLTVASGPNILTLKKKYRNIFESRYEGGKIFQVDLVSLEPRIALAYANKPPPRDIYAYIRDNILSGSVTRQQAKIVTLSCLYGMSHENLRKQLPPGSDISKFRSDVSAYFELPILKKNLKDSYKNQGKIYNIFDREILSETSHVNHFLQSSGVDVSLDCFSNMSRELQKSKVVFSPLFFIHDAFFIDVHPHWIEETRDILQKDRYCDIASCKFPTQVS